MARRPGLGTILLEAALRRGYPVVLAGVAVLSTVFVVLNLMADMLHVWIDPRIRPGSA